MVSKAKHRQYERRLLRSRTIVKKIRDDFQEDLFTIGIIQATDMAVAWIDRVRGELEILEIKEHKDGGSYFEED